MPPYYAPSGLVDILFFIPGATRFALAPGYHISRLWRFQKLFSSPQVVGEVETLDSASALSKHERHKQPLYLLRSLCNVSSLSLTSLHQQPFKLISHANG